MQLSGVELGMAEGVLGGHQEKNYIIDKFIIFSSYYVSLDICFEWISFYFLSVYNCFCE